MNFKHYQIFLLCAFVCLLASCRSDDDPTGNGKLTISSVAVRSIENTRSTSILSSGSLGIFLTNDNGYSPLNNVRYDYSAGQWVANPTDIYLFGKAATLCAYYPYNTTNTDATNIALTSQPYTQNNDLIYTSKFSTASNATPAINLTMQHAYSRLTFFIQNITLPAPCAISQIQISNPALLNAGTIDITNGAYTVGTATGTVTGNPNISGIPTGQSTTTSFLLVPPSSILSGNMTVTCTIDGTPKTTNFDVNAYNLSTIAPGQDYQIYLSLGYPLVESNCYIVKPNDIVYIPISRANTAWAAAGSGTAVPTGDPWNAGLLWTDNSNGMSAAGAIRSIVSNRLGGYIAVRTGSSTGNSVVYLQNSAGYIVWSWHVWVTDYDPNNGGITYTYNNGTNSYTFMDRNLGATSTVQTSLNSRGLIYQWGRKDPFPGANNVSGTSTDRPIYDAYGNSTSIPKIRCNASTNLITSIYNPATFYFNDSGLCDWYTNADATNHQDNLWGGASTSAPGAKTIYDPCPAGWRIPAWNKSISPWQGITLSGATWENYGYTFSSPSLGYVPVAGYRDYATGNLSGVGINGEYWSASVQGNDAYYWYTDKSGAINNGASNHRAQGLSVRCVKDQ